MWSVSITPFSVSQFKVRPHFSTTNLNLILLLVLNEWIRMLAENKHAFKHSRKLCTLLHKGTLIVLRLQTKQTRICAHSMCGVYANVSPTLLCYFLICNLRAKFHRWTKVLQFCRACFARPCVDSVFSEKLMWCY